MDRIEVTIRRFMRSSRIWHYDFSVRVEKTTRRVWRLCGRVVLIFVFIYFVFPIPVGMQAQTGPADPRRIPPKVEWSTLTFSGIDVAVGTDGNPVIAGWDSGHKIRKVNAATGATIWDRNYYPINGELVTPVGVAIGPDNNPVILVKVYR